MLWFIIGMIVTVGLTLLVLWLRNRGIALTWYQWLIGAIGLLLVIGAIQHYGGSLSEGMTLSARIGVLIFGIPGLILIAVAWALVARRQSAAG